MTSAYAQNYIYNNLGPYFGAVAVGDTVGIPSPFEEISRGYFLYGTGASGFTDPHTGLPEKDGKDIKRFQKPPQSPLVAAN